MRAANQTWEMTAVGAGRALIWMTGVSFTSGWTGAVDRDFERLQRLRTERP